MAQSVIEFYNKLCIPTIRQLLKETFLSDNDNNNYSAKNTSLNLSEGQLDDFAQEVLFTELIDDIKNLAEKDPAAKKTSNSVRYVWESYKGLKAVMYYRVAHHLLDFDNNCLIPSKSNYFASETDNDIIYDYMITQANNISNRAAKETTIEINPYAKIGKGFVIDHGIGTKVAPGIPNFSTVIGETCTIGEDCTLLNSVLLGAKVINEANIPNKEGAIGKRHPTLGNLVTVCAGVRILGDIKIGDNVMIGPCCVITDNIPPNYVVTVVNQLQYTRKKKDSPEFDEEGNLILFKEKKNKYPVIQGLGINHSGALILFGDNINNCRLSIVTLDDGKESEISSVYIVIENEYPNGIEFNIQTSNYSDLFRIKHFSLKISYTEQQFPDCEFILQRPQALKQYIDKMIYNYNLSYKED